MPKYYKFGIFAGILIIVVLMGFALSAKKQQSQTNFVTEIQRNVTSEDRRVYEDRQADFLKKLSETNDDAEKYNIYLNLGFNSYVLGHLGDSKNYFEQAIQINADQYDVYQGLFHTQIDMEDYIGATASIKKAISIRKGNAGLWRDYIQFEIERVHAPNDFINNLFGEAITDTTQRGDATNYTDVITTYASWLEKVGNLQEAVNYWKKAIESNPDRKVVFQAEITRLNALIEKR